MNNEDSTGESAGIDLPELERRFAELVESDITVRGEALRVLARSEPLLAQRLAVLLDAHLHHADELAHIGESARSTLGLFDVDALLGRELDGWRLIELLGRGGMGVVFGAQRQRDGVRQDAAIKLLSIPLFQADAAERFRREALTLARLDHPGICRLRDFGRSPEGWPFLVLDRIDGAPLHLHAEGKALTEQLLLIARVADAVAAAHRQLVVHLDIKPENVLVTSAGDPVLLDFGIARVLGEEGEASATATVARWLTPDYAAPERLRGEPSTVAADIHSLGALLYRIVTGRKPFDLAGLSVTEAVARIEKGPEPPSRLIGTLPRDLDAVIARAMHSDAARRYASAGDFADDLRAIVERRPVKARPDSLGYRLRTALRRHPIALPAGFLASAAIIAMAAVLAWQANGLREQRDRAEREAARARAVSDLLIGSIKAADPTGDRSGNTDLGSVVDATSRRIRVSLADQPLLLADGLVAIGDVHNAMGQHAQAIDAYDEALDLMRVAGVSMDEQFDAHFGRFDALRWSGRVAESVAGAESLLDAVGDAARWRVQAGLGVFLTETGELDAAQAHLNEALESVDLNAHDRRAEIFVSLAAVHASRSQHADALDYYAQAMDAFAATDRGSPDTEAVILMNRANLNAVLGQTNESLIDVERALQLRTELFGEAHHLTVEALGFRSTVLTELGHFDEAISSVRRAIEIERSLSGGESLLAAEQWSHLGLALHRGGRLDEAREALERALATYLRHLPPTHPTLATIRNNLASIYGLQGDAEGALGEFLAVYAIHEAISPDQPTVNLAMIASNVAETYVELAQIEPSLAWAGRALEQGRTTLPAGHWVLGYFMSVHASALLLAGDSDAALTEAMAAQTLIRDSNTPAQPIAVRRNLDLLVRIHEARGESTAAAQWREKMEALDAEAP